jgi:hypothetical protein
MSQNNRRQPIHHPDPLWWRHLSITAKIAMGIRVYDTLLSIRVDVGIPDTLLNRLKAVNEAITAVSDFRAVVKKLGVYYTELLELLLNGGDTEQINIEKVKDKLFPDADIIVNGALLGILIEIETRRPLQHRPKPRHTPGPHPARRKQTRPAPANLRD